MMKKNQRIIKGIVTSANYKNDEIEIRVSPDAFNSSVLINGRILKLVDRVTIWIDANNDGRNDIITTNHGNDSVAFMLQDGSGDFYLGWKKTLDNAPFGLTVDDFNLDGQFDAATTQPSGNCFTVLIQQASEIVYDTRRDIYLGSNVRNYNPRAVDIGDINDDGYNDIDTPESMLIIFTGCVTGYRVVL